MTEDQKKQKKQKFENYCIAQELQNKPKERAANKRHEDYQAKADAEALAKYYYNKN